LFAGALTRLQDIAGWHGKHRASRTIPSDVTAGSPVESPSRIKSLDGLRGSGAIGVLCMHAFPLAVFWNWIRMEMFFVLSGFLITTILLRTDLTQPHSLRNFIARRALRIWPVYYVGLFSAFLL